MSDIWIYGGLLAGLLLSDGLLVYAVVSKEGQQRLPEAEQTDREEQEYNLREELRRMGNAVAMMARCIESLDTKVGHLHLGRQEIGSVGTAELKAVEVASKLAGTGVDVEQLVNLCGVTECEAELMQMLHQQRAGASADGEDGGAGLQAEPGAANQALAS